MESRVIFQDGMDNDPADYNNLQDFVQDSMQHVVSDGITSDRKFAGFAATATGTAQVTVQPGRFYSAGMVFSMADVLVKDFTTSLPISAKKIVTIAIWGAESDTDIRPREFLINEDTGASEPRSVAMERARIANIGFSAGSESTDPIAPILDAGVMAVAKVLLGPAGVLSVTMEAANTLDSVASVSDRVESLEGFRDQSAPQIVSLASDLAALKVGVSGNVSVNAYGRMLSRLAVLEAKDGVPSSAADSSADFYLDTSMSDTANGSYSAAVSEGVHFPYAAVSETAINIFDSLNPKAKITSGVLFPAYTRSLRIGSGGPFTGEAQISQYSYTTHSLVQKAMSRTRIRYGESFTVSTSSTWWQSGKFDYATKTFAKSGETFTVSDNDGYRIGNNIVRVTQFWYDTVEDPYWTEVTTTTNVNGAQVAQTFLNANDMWLESVGLVMSSLAATGTLTVAVCETLNGAPDITKTIATTTVDRSALHLGGAGMAAGGTETIITLPPTFLQGGKRYAIVLITAADHRIYTVPGGNLPSGSFFYVLDGAYQQGDGSRDLAFNLYACKFASSRQPIELTALTLTGGMSVIDILASSIVPDSCQLIYEVQVNSVWIPLQETGTSALATLPPLVPIRAVFVGTQDVMPCVTLTGSRCRVARPATAFTHISTVRTPPASTSSIRVTGRLEGFDSAHHTCVAKLRTGAGYTTLTSVSSTVDVTNADGSIERTWLFNLGSPITSYKIEIDGTTDSALNTFVVSLRKDYVL